MAGKKLFEIVNPVIEAVSLVKRGANKIKFRILKSEGGFERRVEFRKTAARQIAFGEVYRPGQADSHGDFMTQATIERMAQQFLRSGLVRNVDTEHDGQQNGSEIVESFIARAGDSDFAEGAWVLGVKINDPKLWAAVQKGEITGFSMFGTGERIERDKIVKAERPTFGGDEPYPQPQDTRVQEPHNSGVSSRYGAAGRVPNPDADAALDRHRTAEKALGIKKDHSLDGMIRHAKRRRSGWGW